MDERTPLHNNQLTADGVSTHHEDGPRDGDGPRDKDSPRDGDGVVSSRIRWWILLVFCYCSAVQGSVWNTWGPINYSVLIVFGWTDTFSALIPAMADIGLITMALPMIYIAQSRGLRPAMVLCMCLLMLTMSLWVIGTHLEMTWMIYIGGSLIGITSGIFMSGPPLVSAVWFPVRERTTATAVAIMAGFFGESIGFMTGPAISGSSGITEADVNRSSSLSPEYKSRLESGISTLMYYNAGIVLAGSLLVLAYFPSLPHRPPSRSATVERINFKSGLRALSKDMTFWQILLAYNLPNGVFNAWIPLLSVSFKPLGISQETGGWIGLTTVLTASTVSVLVSTLVDRFKRRMKLIMVIMTAGQIFGFGFIVCIQQNYFQITSHTTLTALLYMGCITAGICINGPGPLYFEFACENAFPVQEGLVGALICWTNDLFSLMFLLLFLIPAVARDTQWMTWLCLALCTVSLPLLLCVKESYKRLNVEEYESNGT